MKSYLELYKKGDKKMEQEAFNRIVNDLLRDNLKGAAKQKEVTSVDTEGAATRFVPSSFYIFGYLCADKDKPTGGAFYDAVPMIFCTGATPKSVEGINFNFLPNDVRAAFIDIITGSYPSFYGREVYEGKPAVNENLAAKIVDKKNLGTMLVLLKSELHVDLSKCIRTYDRSKMLNPRMIEVDEWKYIPFLSFKDAVRGATLAKAQMSVLEGENKYKGKQ